ncbi:MAG: Ig-like domain-containing protein [Steroidobacteraceae bacterium]
MHRLSIMAGMCAALLAGCGGGSKTISTEGSSSSTGTTGTTGTGTTAATVLSLGSGSGSSFQSGVIGVSTSALSAGGSTSLEVSLVDQNGTLYTQPTQIVFSSTCAGNNLATITVTGAATGTATVTTSTGTASATYAAKGCSGSDAITATTTANSQTLTATGTVTIAQAAIGSISFVSATPSSISLKGTGSAGGSETSTLIFQVLDTSGGPRAGATVTFSLNTSVGGISISPASAVTGANGQVQTIVSSGNQATSVRVTATTTSSSGTTISTESNALTVSTGIPTSQNISLAVKCPNVEAWEIDGVTVPVTVSMTDRFSNPVPDGTTANFQTTLGGIQASCQTGTPTSGSGSCTVNWSSKAPYTVSGNPQSTSGNASANAAYCPGNLCNGTTNGRSPIMVTAIGEESFRDANGNGIFDPGDTVAFDAADADNDYLSGANLGQPKPWFDTSEPFLNQWELYDTYGTPTYVLGEPYIDFNNNGQRDGPDGLFEGPLCEGPLCNTTQTSVAIGAFNVIILSGSTANVTVVSPTTGAPYSVSAGTTNFTFNIADDRDQQMPAGTTVAASVVPGTAGSVVAGTPYTWPCAFPVGGQHVSFALSNQSTTPTAGTLYITVTTPGGIVTTYSYPLAN